MADIRKIKKSPNNKNNRLNFILAVIFLLSGAIIYRLFYLQVMQNDLYVALASDQHQIYNTIDSKRGSIYMQDGRGAASEKLYPLVTNKDFALVYAVPQKITDPDVTAEKLYEIFDQDDVDKEVGRLLAADPALKPNDNGEEADQSRELEDFKEIKRQAEIELRKKAIIESYRQKLAKANDPYEPIKIKVDEETLGKLLALKLAGIDYITVNYRFYPEKDMGAQVSGFVGFKNDVPVGQYGLEGFFDKELAGVSGSLKAERSANGKFIILNDREYQKAQDGSDLILTVNRSLQYYACEKLAAAVVGHGADSGSVIVVEPQTGAILAMCSYPSYDPNNYNEVERINIYNNPAIFDQYEPGSIFKAITMAAGIDQGKVSPETTYEDKGSVMVAGWNSPIKNSDFDQVGGHGLVDMNTVLEMSLNTGAIFVMQKTGDKTFADYVKKFGFGEKTGIELETEGDGNINSLIADKIRPIEAATASFGQGITATPLQMVMSYAAIANDGILMKPYLVKEIVGLDGIKTKTETQQIRRVISSHTAALMGAMLVNVVENGHGKRAAVKGYYISGKTGTAQVPKKGGGYEANAYIGSFCGFGPVEDPIFTMIVKINNPRDVAWAESSAAPLFGDIARFILDYYQVPKNR
jgi:cell division protein FtsI/penicillin-binding protein 2